MSDAYQQFIAGKSKVPALSGFEVLPGALPPAMKPFQRAVTEWSLRLGRAALFEGTGLGKTVQELAWARCVREETRKPVLILAPLAVAEQTVLEAEKFDIDGVRYAPDQASAKTPIVVTNYDRAHLFDFSRFGGVVLDESSILKAHDGKTRAALTEACASVPFRLPATATPAPNDWTEIGQHAEFLGVMRAKEMLAMYFVHDGANRADGGGDGWRLKRHAERDFWRWVASWAVMIRSPADLGFDEPGYVLPPLIKHQITVEAECRPTGDMLFPMQATTMSERISARRDSISPRISAALDLILSSLRHRGLICGNLNTTIESAPNIGPTQSIENVSEPLVDRPRKTKSTCAPITNPTNKIGIAALQNNDHAITPSAAPSTPPTPSGAPAPSNTIGNTLLMGESATSGSLENSVSRRPATQPSSRSKAGSARSAAGEGPTSAGIDSTSTIATSPGQSAASCAPAATSALASSETTTRRLSAPSNISWTPEDQWIIWCGLNDEQDAIEAALGPLCFSVYGSLSREEKVNRIHGWLRCERPVLVSKVSICGFGLNFQQCSRMVFVGLNDSFEQLFQALRRCWRFGQTKPVNAYLIASELEGAVVSNLERKEREFEAMATAMAEHMRELTKANVLGAGPRRSAYAANRPMELPTWLK